jgi:hypothetical protein
MDAYIQLRKKNAIGKKMTQKLISEREAVAVAACDVAGREHPLPAETPEKSRVYLFACPEDAGGKFSVDDLSDRLDGASVQHGVDWDRESKTYGLRFLTSSMPIPAEVRPFATPEARREWEAWRERETQKSAAVVEAAMDLADGKPVNFLSDNEIGPEKGRRRNRRAGERD